MDRIENLENWVLIFGVKDSKDHEGDVVRYFEVNTDTGKPEEVMEHDIPFDVNDTRVFQQVDLKRLNSLSKKELKELSLALASSVIVINNRIKQIEREKK